MYVLQVSPRHLMTWHLVRVYEKLHTQMFLAHAFADFVRGRLVFPYWALTTTRAKISLLPVEFDEVITVFFEWQVAKFVIVGLFLICIVFFPRPRPAELMTHTVAGKHIIAGLRNTVYPRSFVITGAVRSQYEGSIV